MECIKNKMAYVDRTYSEMMLSNSKETSVLCGACGLPVFEEDSCFYGIMVVERDFIAYEAPRKWSFHRTCTPKLARMVERQKRVIY